MARASSVPSSFGFFCSRLERAEVSPVAARSRSDRALPFSPAVGAEMREGSPESALPDGAGAVSADDELPPPTMPTKRAASIAVTTSTGASTNQSGIGRFATRTRPSSASRSVETGPPSTMVTEDGPPGNMESSFATGGEGDGPSTAGTVRAATGATGATKGAAGAAGATGATTGAVGATGATGCAGIGQAAVRTFAGSDASDFSGAAGAVSDGTTTGATGTGNAGADGAAGREAAVGAEAALGDEEDTVGDERAPGSGGG